MNGAWSATQLAYSLLHIFYFLGHRLSVLPYLLYFSFVIQSYRDLGISILLHLILIRSSANSIPHCCTSGSVSELPCGEIETWQMFREHWIYVSVTLTLDDYPSLLVNEFDYGRIYLIPTQRIYYNFYLKMSGCCDVDKFDSPCKNGSISVAKNIGVYFLSDLLLIPISANCRPNLADIFLNSTILMRYYD